MKKLQCTHTVASKFRFLNSNPEDFWGFLTGRMPCWLPEIAALQYRTLEHFVGDFGRAGSDLFFVFAAAQVITAQDMSDEASGTVLKLRTVTAQNMIFPCPQAPHRISRFSTTMRAATPRRYRSLLILVCLRGNGGQGIARLFFYSCGLVFVLQTSGLAGRGHEIILCPCSQFPATVTTYTWDNDPTSSPTCVV